MISNQILQNTIEGLKGITRIDFCVMDTDGKPLASTMTEQENYEEEVLAFVDSPADSQVVRGYQFFKIFEEHQLEYVLLANGGSDDVYMVGKIAAFQIQNLLVAYKERFDKDNFIKNLLLDNLLLVDIYNRAKKLHIDTEVRRVVFIIETDHEKDSNALDNVRNLLGNKSKDFVTAVDEKNIIIVNMGFIDVVMFNPVIVSKHDMYETEEGCLSLDGVRKTTRYQEIEVEYYDFNWKKQRQKLSGWTAQICQHEIDHLSGKII